MEYQKSISTVNQNSRIFKILNAQLTSHNDEYIISDSTAVNENNACLSSGKKMASLP